MNRFLNSPGENLRNEVELHRCCGELIFIIGKLTLSYVGQYSKSDDDPYHLYEGGFGLLSVKTEDDDQADYSDAVQNDSHPIYNVSRLVSKLVIFFLKKLLRMRLHAFSFLVELGSK